MLSQVIRHSLSLLITYLICIDDISASFIKYSFAMLSLGALYNAVNGCAIGMVSRSLHSFLEIENFIF